MKSSNHPTDKGRRNALKILGLGSAALLAGGFRHVASAQAPSAGNLMKPPVGLPPIKIKSVKAKRDVEFCWSTY